MGCVGGMTGKENHMDGHAEHYGREGHSEGMHGAASYHKSAHAETGVQSNASRHHDTKKAAGTGQSSGHGSVKAAEKFGNIHAHNLNNK
jgi:hypothetical protein